MFEQSSCSLGPCGRKIVGPSRSKVPRVVSSPRPNPARCSGGPGAAGEARASPPSPTQDGRGGHGAGRGGPRIGPAARHEAPEVRSGRSGSLSRRAQGVEPCTRWWPKSPAFERHPPVGPKLPRRKTPRHRTRGIPQRELPGPTCEADHQRRCRAAQQTPRRTARLDREVDQTEREPGVPGGPSGTIL